MTNTLYTGQAGGVVLFGLAAMVKNDFAAIVLRTRTPPLSTLYIQEITDQDDLINSFLRKK